MCVLQESEVFWSPLSPPAAQRTFSSKLEMQAHYINNAKRAHKERAASRECPVDASCKQIGAYYGVGLGLYFKVLSW